MASEDRKSVREFWCIWFEQRQEWHVILGNLEMLGPFPAIGYATNEAYKVLGRGEVEFVCEFDGGECFHYHADEEFWQH